MASVSEALNLCFYSILLNFCLSLNSHKETQERPLKESVPSTSWTRSCPWAKDEGHVARGVIHLAPQVPTRSHFWFGGWWWYQWGQGAAGGREWSPDNTSQHCLGGSETTSSVQFGSSLCAQSQLLTIVQQGVALLAAAGSLARPAFTGCASALAHFSLQARGLCWTHSTWQ